jgi:hypothetical protein
MPRKAIVVGLDCLSPKLTLKFAKEGLIPNIKKLMDAGVFSKALPCFPAWTPTNWTTIATGAYPGTHGVFMWGTHVPGDPIERDERRWAMSSSICTAEYVWESAAKVGRKTLLFYFVGYPQTTDKAVHVDWLLSPGTYFFEICSSACYTNIGVGEKVELKPSSGWGNPPADTQPLEGHVQVAPKDQGQGPGYHLLVTGEGGEYDRVILSKEKDLQGSVELRVGQWSDWLYEEFQLEAGTVTGSVRFKLVELSPDAQRLRLYRSQVYPLEEFTVPKELAKTLVDRFGPYINEDVAHAYTKGLVDWQTVEEELDYQIRWIGEASAYLMEETGTTLFFNHWHLLDTLKHHCLGLLDPAGAMYDPSKAEAAWDEMRKGYALIGSSASWARWPTRTP